MPIRVCAHGDRAGTALGSRDIQAFAEALSQAPLRARGGMMKTPTFTPDDLVIMGPTEARGLNDPEMPGDRFYLLRVTADKGASFDFDLVESGPCALVEAWALLALKPNRKIWTNHALKCCPRERRYDRFGRTFGDYSDEADGSGDKTLD